MTLVSSAAASFAGRSCVTRPCSSAGAAAKSAGAAARAASSKATASAPGIPYHVRVAPRWR